MTFPPLQAQRSLQPRTVVDTIDLTYESQPPSRNVLSDTSQHAPASSMAIPTARPRLPSDQLTTAINEGNQSRNQHAQATRKLPKSQPFDLTIFFYTGGYKDISQGLLQSKKYQAGSPYLAYKVTHCFVTDPARRYESHADFVNSLVRLATTDGNFVRLDWELISSCQSNTPSTIASFPHEIYNTTSLIEFYTRHIPRSPRRSSLPSSFYTRTRLQAIARIRSLQLLLVRLGARLLTPYRRRQPNSLSHRSRRQKNYRQAKANVKYAAWSVGGHQGCA